jgi:hypothetical protein
MKVILILSIFVLHVNSIISSNNNNFYNNNIYNNKLQINMLRLRNTSLRLKLSHGVEKVKYYYKKMYTKTLNLYFDINREYYSLSDEVRMLIESIITLSC